jgi:hypothetical protein
MSALKNFLIPSYSTEISELSGIMLGDGGISDYQVIITLNSVDDSEYVLFVKNLIENLFGITPSLYYRKTASAVHIVVSRKGLVEFLVNTCGLVKGHKIKNQASIPDWIKNSTELEIACIRGLIDTDGSIFNHRYYSKAKEYSYKKLSFTSVSKPLLLSAYDILRKMEFNCRLGSNHDLRIDSVSDMKKYFEVIGSHNPKHLKRYAT